MNLNYSLHRVDCHPGVRRDVFPFPILVGSQTRREEEGQATTLGSIMQIDNVYESSIEPVVEWYFHQPVYSVQKG